MLFSNREYEDRQRLGFTNENIDLEYRLPTYDMDANYIRIVTNCIGIAWELYSRTHIRVHGWG